MPEPISSSVATSTLTGLVLLSALPGVDFSVVLGALTGALLFIATSDEPTLWRKVFLSVASFLSGLLMTDMASQLLATVLPLNVFANKAVAALLASALTVRLLQAILRNQDRLLDALFKKGEKS